MQTVWNGIKSISLGLSLLRLSGEEAEERAEIYDEINYDLEAMAHILGLQSVESVKRLARKGKLPDRIPGIKKYLWLKKDVESWIEARHKLPPRTEEEDKAIILALKKGVPIEQITLYGHYLQGLLEWYRKWKQPDDTETASQ